MGGGKMKTSKLIGVVALVALALIVPEQTLASWPGENGKIAFAYSTKNGKFNVFSVTSKGKDLEKLTKPGHGGCCPSYSPSGRSILFNRLLRPNHRAIFQMKADGTSKQKVLAGESLRNASWSPNGKKIVFSNASTDSCDSCIFKMNRNGSNVVEIELDGRVTHPLWSPDGDRISFVRKGESEDEPKPGLYTADPDGSDEQLVLHTEHELYPPTALDWHPNGDRFAFWCHETGDKWALCLMNEDGSGMRRAYGVSGTLRFRLYDNPPDWSPNGKRIVVWGTNRFFVVNRRTGESRQVFRVPKGRRLSSGSWQPQ
jgi:Tol biopolymer transport system component